MAERFKLRRKRIGSSQQHQPANRVNKFLSQAIDARSVDQEKAHNVNMFSLCFRDPEKEREVITQQLIYLLWNVIVMIGFTVPRRRGFGISRRPCLCFITAAFDGRRASRCLAQNKNPFAFVSYCIYLGGCNTHTSTRCQVNLKISQKNLFKKNCLLL